MNVQPFTYDDWIGVGLTSSIGEGAAAMAHFVGLDVSVEETAVCVVDDVGKVLCERKVRTEPEDIAVLLTSIGGDYVRIGIEAGPLSQWLVNGCSRPSRSISLQRCTGNSADDARRPVQAGACEDVDCPGTTDAADQPQARPAQADGHRVRHARHTAQLWPQVEIRASRS